MDSQKVDLFILINSKNFPEDKLPIIRERLLKLPEDKWVLLSLMQFNDPTLSLILSIFLGPLGIDRFFIGDIGMGIGKLLTGGGCGIWTIIDWFFIMNATREKNFTQLAMTL